MQCHKEQMHVLSGCNTVSHHFNMGEISALNTLQADSFPVLYQVLGDEDATRSDLIEKFKGSSQPCMVSH